MLTEYTIKETIVRTATQQVNHAPKQFLRIFAKNRYNAAPLEEGMLPETTKRDKRFHGYGWKSIRSTVEKYGGSVTMHGADGWFELGILIPLAEETE